jgi:hypothetical protein
MMVNRRRLHELYGKYTETYISEDELVEFKKIIFFATDKELECFLAIEWEKTKTEEIFTKRESSRILNAILNPEK